MVETEARYNQPIRIILYGKAGTYIIPEGINTLMPLQFVPDSLKDVE
jgi:hypothetical protein